MTAPRIGIDLHNIRDGGGVNYMRNLLSATDSARDGFESVVLIGAPSVLDEMPEAPYLLRHPVAELGRGLRHRIAWVARHLSGTLRTTGCDVLYAPGGVVPGRFRPYVTISRNMMPFSPELWGLYPWGADRLRLHALNRVHRRAFANADAMIYLTRAARERIEPSLGTISRPAHVIAHGVNQDLFRPPDRTVRDAPFDPAGDLHLVYPSRLEPYKHQIEVIEAVMALRPRYQSLRMTFLGWANADYEAKVRAAMATADPGGAIFAYPGAVPGTDLPGIYADAHLMVFASSCENLPNTLIEAMASGLPVVCSDAEPMPEVGGPHCLYFDPRRPDDIARAIDTALSSYEQTLQRAEAAREAAGRYDWARCAEATFAAITGPLAGMARPRREGAR